MVFTGDTFLEGTEAILDALKKYGAKGSFFLTGGAIELGGAAGMIDRIVGDGHYLGPHSDKHLLYCDWGNRDSLLVSQEEFESDLLANYHGMERWGITKGAAPYFIPPYEWYNAEIVRWTEELGLTLVNFTPGLRTAADYTFPEMGLRYLSSEEIYESLMEYEETRASGLNGFIILIHMGTDSRRKDKFYDKLNVILPQLTAKNYSFERIDNMMP